MFGRKSAINKAKKQASIKSKTINRRKQIIRNKEFFKIKQTAHNTERLQECHSLANFSKENNMIIPKLKINTKAYSIAKNKNTFYDIKKGVMSRQQSSIQKNKSSSKLNSLRKHNKMLTITVSELGKEIRESAVLSLAEDESIFTESKDTNSGMNISYYV